ncbi:UNVERIFIED_CONTAM: protein NO VEIN [Sesamum latifolium]|uniref:Protein NO VEIN n=1 Tax=Sesamum latifolium TaxID=2727402 RepID=A0AAW2VYX1_9LAMI
MAMNEELLRPYTSEEIVHALKQMHPLKSPGPDGMSPIFYQKHWDIVGHDICACVLDFLNNGSLNSSFNFTHVVLIPKNSNPSDMSHFRPISLCNVLYKLASKVIANRLKPLLSSLISTSQSAFVPGRFITDNVLVAYELNHFLMHKTWGKLGHVSLKLDVSKAYDRVEWCFLERVLRAFSSLIRRAETEGELHGSHKNVAVASRLALARIIGVAVVSKHEKYLGLPTVVGKSKREVFQGVKDRIWKKLNCWSSKHLSQAGRVVLIKSVLFTIPSYVMSCFRLPDSFLHEIESLFADFFGAEDWFLKSTGCHGIDCAIPGKRVVLGLGVSEKARLGSKPSFTWRSLLGTRELLVAGLRWKVGDGSSIPIRGQPWLPRPSTFQLIARPATLMANTKVVALITVSGVWDHELIRAEFSPLDAECILSIELRGSGAQDEIVWHYESNGRFSVHSAYRIGRQLNRETEGSNLRKKGLSIDGGCYWCDEETEDVMHVMRFCNFARLVWALSGLPWGVIGVHTICTETWFRTVHREIRGPNFDYFLTICWALWKGRNLVAFEGTKMLAHEIVRVAIRSCPAALDSAMGLRPKEGGVLINHRPSALAAAARGAQPPQQQQIHLNPNFFPNPNLFLLQQNPNYLHHLNPFVQNLNSFAQLQQQFPNSSFPVQLNSDSNNFQTPRPNGNSNSKYPQQVKVQNEMVEKLDKAVMRARADLLASNENVSAWKVSQAALLTVKAESWESLGIQIQQVPSLNRLLATEGKINAFIHCFVAVRRITSLYDLEVAICENEGVERFEELELGPLVRHPLAIHYFSVTSGVTEVCRIRTEDIISYLCEFIDSHKKKEVKVDTFLDFISKKQSISGWEKLCVRVQNFGVYVNHIKEARQLEDRILEKCYQERRVKSSKRKKKSPPFSAQKKEMDDHFTAISQRMKSFSSANTQFCGKHIRFISSSEDDDSETHDYEDNQDEKNTDSNSNSSLSQLNVKDRVSSCPYPSATEEMTRLGLKSEVASSPCMSGGGVRCNGDNELSRGKRRYESVSSGSFVPRKLPKRDKCDADLKHKRHNNQGITGDSLSTESLKVFFTTWKEECQGNNADEVLERMLQFYNTRKKRKVKEMFTSYPFVGLLYAAVSFPHLVIVIVLDHHDLFNGSEEF